jgi:hypothetical protein
MSRKYKFYYNRTGIMGTLHEDQYTFLIISCSLLLRVRNVSDVSCLIPFFENFTVYEIIWEKNTVERTGQS